MRQRRRQSRRDGTHQGGQKVTQVTSYNDYRDVKGVKVPFNTIMNVGIELDIKISEVKINEGVSDADFQ